MVSAGATGGDGIIVITYTPAVSLTAQGRSSSLAKMQTLWRSWARSLLVGTNALSGQDVSLERDFNLAGPKPARRLTGQDVTLTYTPADNPTSRLSMEPN